MWQLFWHTLLLWFLKIDEEKTTWTKFLPRSGKDAFSERTLRTCSMNSTGSSVYFRGDRDVMQIIFEKINFPVALLASSWRVSHDSLPHCILCRSSGWKAALLIDLKYTLEPCTLLHIAFFETESRVGGEENLETVSFKDAVSWIRSHFCYYMIWRLGPHLTNPFLLFSPIPALH